MNNCDDARRPIDRREPTTPEHPEWAREEPDSATEEAFAELVDHLSGLPPGLVENAAALEQLLAACWAAFEGCDMEQMSSYKLIGRTEQLRWKPPRLRFLIERHGLTHLGSSRAEVHEWIVDIEAKTADCEYHGYRQVYKRNPPLKVQPLAEETVRLIVAGADDERLKWTADRSRVTIRVGNIIPDDCPKQTLIARRRRFREAIRPMLHALGWTEVPHTTANTYECKRSAE